tara:strand:- start:40 stop:1971 length:1932 start_codon:yes stop_codon:yes gene_type:complete
MKIKLNTIKSILKFIIIIVLLGLAAYFLYKIVSDNLIEGFDPTDCSDCKMNPTSGDCFEIKNFDISSNDISYERIVLSNSQKQGQFDDSVIDNNINNEFNQKLYEEEIPFYIEYKNSALAPTHRTIVYKRLTPIKESQSDPGLDMWRLFTQDWFDSSKYFNGRPIKNTMGTDFKLFSSMDDAINDNAEWTFCNFNDPGIGIPRDCGPNGPKGWQWITLTRAPYKNTRGYGWSDWSFSLVKEKNRISETATIIPSDTTYIFCPWQPNCLNSFATQQERLNMSVEEISNNEAIIGNTCCDGVDFYNNNTNFYQNFFIYDEITTKCNELDNFLIDLSNSTGGKQSDEYKSVIANMYELGPTNTCQNNLSNKNKKGMLFKRETGSPSVVFLEDDMTPSEILDYIAINNIKQELIQNNSEKYNEILGDLNKLADFSNNNLSSSEKLRVDQHKRDLYYDFSLSSVTDINYQYRLYNTSGETPTNNFLLNENQFYSCSGEIVNQQQLNDMSFNQSQLDDFNNNNYFGDPSLNTLENEEARFYNTENDLKMQLKNLPDLNQSSMAPVSVINQYMTSINSFYEKQMANMMGPKTHSVNDTLHFDNGTLESKQSTFFSYNNEPNNEYECENSITGNPIFDYCGPKSYHDDTLI